MRMDNILNTQECPLHTSQHHDRRTELSLSALGAALTWIKCLLPVDHTLPSV